MNLGCDVVIGCNSTQKEILRLEFEDDCRYVELTGYGIRYGKNRGATFARLLLQSLKILIRIKQENRWLRSFLQQEGVNAVISDNRFGLYSSGIPSIFITHQLQIKTGLGAWADAIVRRWNYGHINRFSTCWVPDEAGHSSMAGELSHPPQLPKLPVRYLGGLSRFDRCTATGKGALLIILSGPEPQRSIYEGLLLEQLNRYTGKVILVRGLPLSPKMPDVPEHITLLNHASASTLHGLICDASLVISRSGYTTVMDLLAMQKKAILVPTPGQAEQEYLAIHLKQQGWAYTTAQKDFSLAKALREAEQFAYRLPSLSMDGYKPIVGELVASISRHIIADGPL
jgi:UDP-N-acetylglucosamine transferase subunit ALG13